MTAPWSNISQALDSGERFDWGALATDLFSGHGVPDECSVAERLMLRAESSVDAATARRLLDQYLAYCRRTGHPEAAFDYLADNDVLHGDDADLVHQWVELADALGKDAELCAGLDWLRHRGFWGDAELRLETKLVRRQGDKLLAAEPAETRSALGALRRFGQSLGLAASGRRPSVLELVPAELPLQVGEVQVRQAAGPARVELTILLQRALDSSSSKAALVGLDSAAEQMLWLGQLDGAVLDAVRFAGAGNPNALNELLQSTAWHAAGDVDGHLARLAGYVAEQQTKLHLLQQGHQVEMPESPTQAGYDLLVDGQPVQVKHAAGPAIIDEHRHLHPDVAVIANVEHAERFQDDPMVWTDAQRGYSDPYDAIDGTLEALHDAPFISAAPLHLALAGMRHICRSRSWKDYGEHVVKDAGASIAFTGGGFWLFSGVAGMALGPVGVAVAGTLGAMVGSGVGDAVGKAWIGEHIGEKNDAVAERLIELALWARDVAVPDKLDAAERETTRIRRLLARPALGQLPTAITAFWRAVAKARVKQLRLFADRLDERLGGCEADRIKAGWQVLQAGGQIAHPEIRPRIAALHEELGSLRA